jgi:hypothetical protein
MLMSLWPEPSSSSSDSDDSDDEDILLIGIRSTMSARRRSTKQWSVSWWTRIVPSLDDVEFKKHFRLSRAAYESLCDSLQRRWVRPGEAGRPPMDIEKAVAIALWRLANTVTYREIGEQFGERLGTVQRVCRRTMELIGEIHQDVVRMPSTRQEWAAARLQWSHASFSNTVGAVDGSHIRLIFPPTNSRRRYQNRKKFPSIVMQAIVNHRLMFIDVTVGAEGSIHDSGV